MHGYAVVDVETTGFSPAKHDRVIEVAVVQLDTEGRVLDEWCTLVNPVRDLGAQHVHAIRAADVRHAPTFDVVAPHLAGRMAGRVLVAHNLAFDALFLAAEFARAGLTVPIAVERGLCTMRLADHHLGAVSRSLAGCCAAAGVPQGQAHTALDDARAAAGLLAHYLRLTGQPPPWWQEVEAAAVTSWPSAGQLPPLVPAQRTTAEQQVPGAWLDRLARLPRVSEPPVADAYLEVLDRALLDRQLSLTEQEALLSLAEQLELSGDQVRELHREYLAALAAAAWADGMITDDEFADLRSVAVVLGLDAPDVEVALERGRATGSARDVDAFRLRTGHRVVFTGQMRLERDIWADRAERAGLVVLPSVTKKTDLVVAADCDSLSGKARKAASYGLPVVDEQTFERWWTAMARQEVATPRRPER